MKIRVANLDMDHLQEFVRISRTTAEKLDMDLSLRGSGAMGLWYKFMANHSYGCELENCPVRLLSAWFVDFLQNPVDLSPIGKSDILTCLTGLRAWNMELTSINKTVNDELLGGSWKKSINGYKDILKRTFINLQTITGDQTPLERL